jgi:hypothetical protein
MKAVRLKIPKIKRKNEIAKTQSNPEIYDAVAGGTNRLANGCILLRSCTIELSHRPLAYQTPTKGTEAQAKFVVQIYWFLQNVVQ